MLIAFIVFNNPFLCPKSAVGRSTSIGWLNVLRYKNEYKMPDDCFYYYLMCRKFKETSQHGPNEIGSSVGNLRASETNPITITITRR